MFGADAAGTCWTTWLREGEESGILGTRVGDRVVATISEQRVAACVGRVGRVVRAMRDYSLRLIAMAVLVTVAATATVLDRQALAGATSASRSLPGIVFERNGDLDLIALDASRTGPADLYAGMG